MLGYPSGSGFRDLYWRLHSKAGGKTKAREGEGQRRRCGPKGRGAHLSTGVSSAWVLEGQVGSVGPNMTPGTKGQAPPPASLAVGSHRVGGAEWEPLPAPGCLGLGWPWMPAVEVEGIWHHQDPLLRPQPRGD